MSLASLAAREPAAHRHYDTIGSTNEAALAWARENRFVDVAPVWVTADIQTSGRGRRGREWSSPKGNLYATVVRTVHGAVGLPNLPLRAALALRDAIVRTSPTCAERLRFKWPNDLLLDRRKVSGILLEATSVGDRSVVAIGFGVNCASHPEDTRMPATDLREAGMDVNPETLFACLRSVLPEWLRATDDNVLAQWRANAAGIGEPIVIRLPDEEIEGTFETLADDGRLVLAGSDGRTRMIAAGDVFFPNKQGLPMTNTNDGRARREA